MNIFENQVIPIGIHNLSKSLDQSWLPSECSLGIKFIPKTECLKWKNVCSKFEDFRRRMNNKMFFFVENPPGYYVRDKFFRIKNTWNEMIQKHVQQRKTELRKLRLNKNVKVVINDTEKNVGPACANKMNVINECRRQLYEKEVDNKLT